MREGRLGGGTEGQAIHFTSCSICTRINFSYYSFFGFRGGGVHVVGRGVGRNRVVSCIYSMVSEVIAAGKSTAGRRKSMSLVRIIFQTNTVSYWNFNEEEAMMVSMTNWVAIIK